MAIWQLDSQFRALDYATDDWYYWTVTYYWLQNDGSTTPVGSVLDTLQSATWGMARQSSYRDLYRVRGPNGVYDATTADGHYGAWNGYGYGHLLGWCAYMRGYDRGGNCVARKKLRGPWSTAEIIGGRVLPELRDYLQSYADNVLSSLPLCNWLGTQVVSWTVDDVCHMWQQRHGSKRASRAVLAVP